VGEGSVLLYLSECFHALALEDPHLLASLPERFVLTVIPLDEPEALSLALEGLSRARTWEGEGLLVYALFRGRSCSWSSPPRTP
jgi:hypothetical protein